MTREERAFAVALLVSLGAHAFFTGVLFSLPEKAPEEKVVVYTVRIVEIPPRPKVRQLSLSTSAISALKLQSPSLRVNPRPGSEPAPPGLAEADLIPKTGPSFKALPAPKAKPFFKASPVPKAGPSLLPPPPKSSKSVRRDFREPAPQGVKARPKDALPGSKSVFPKLPEPPARLSPKWRSGPPRPTPPRAAVDPPKVPRLSQALIPAKRPPPKSLMDQARERVKKLKVEIEDAPAPPRKKSVSLSSEARIQKYLRRFSKELAKAVKKEYTFPGSGGFKSGLRTRARVAFNQDGSVRSIDILESSGNRTFDQVVCRSNISKVKMPPVPEWVPLDRLVRMMICKP